MGATELRPGMRVRFLNGDPDPIWGVVNGAPWVYFDGVSAVARVPVFVPETNACIDVAGGNVLSVREQAAGVTQ